MIPLNGDRNHIDLTVGNFTMLSTKIRASLEDTRLKKGGSNCNNFMQLRHALRS